MSDHNCSFEDLVIRCGENFGKDFDKRAIDAMGVSLRETTEDAFFELGRSELLFVITITSLAEGDIAMSSILMNPLETWGFHPQLRHYFADKVKVEFDIPKTKDILARAAKFAERVQDLGLITFPPYLIPLIEDILEKLDRAEGSDDEERFLLHGEFGGEDSEGSESHDDEERILLHGEFDGEDSEGSESHDDEERILLHGEFDGEDSEGSESHDDEEWIPLHGEVDGAEGSGGEERFLLDLEVDGAEGSGGEERFLLDLEVDGAEGSGGEERFLLDLEEDYGDAEYI